MLIYTMLIYRQVEYMYRVLKFNLTRVIINLSK